MDFIEVVAAAKREAKGDATDQEIAWLRDPRNRSAWMLGLSSAIQDAADQFAQQRERLERVRADAEAGLISPDAYRAVSDSYEAWIKKASRYRLGLEQRLVEVSDEDRSQASVLRRAIEQHRHDRYAGVPDADVRLYQHLL